MFQVGYSETGHASDMPQLLVLAKPANLLSFQSGTTGSRRDCGHQRRFENLGNEDQEKGNLNSNATGDVVAVSGKVNEVGCSATCGSVDH